MKPSISRSYQSNYHRLGGLNGRNLLFTVQESETLRSGGHHGLILVRALFQAGRWLCSHCVPTWERERESEQEISHVSSYKGTNLIISILLL